MRAVQVLVWAAIGISLCRRVRKSPQSAKKIARITAGWLLFLIFLQCAMAVRGGYASLQTLLPLHLCSAIAVLTVPMMIRWDVRFFPLSWYLGMPGALLALCVPVYGFSPWPHLAQAVFTATHATLVFAPLLMRCAGVQPTRLSAWYAFAAGNGLLVLAEITNGWLDANYLFLRYPPAHTPLAWLAAHGKIGYLAALEICALLLIKAMSVFSVGRVYASGGVSSDEGETSGSPSDRMI